MSLYGYNQSALVNVGQQVKAGQPIALVETVVDKSVQRSILKLDAKEKQSTQFLGLGRRFYIYLAHYNEISR